MNNKSTNAQIRYAPNAYAELLRYLNQVKELQYQVNDELEITRDRVQRLEVDVYRLQATTQALCKHISATANVVPPYSPRK